jgi:hypothetical protein
MLLIGILRWIVELGRVDICCEVSMMSSCLALPRIGHLQQLYYIFAYLKKHHNTEMVFDATEPDINMTDFEKKDWSNTVYVPGDGEIKEALPTDMPKPRGKGSCRRYCDTKIKNRIFNLFELSIDMLAFKETNLN